MPCGGFNRGRCGSRGGPGVLLIRPAFGPGFGHPSFSHCGTRSEIPISPGMVAAGLRGLYTHAAPFLHQIADLLEEQMIAQAVRMSMEGAGEESHTSQETGPGTGAPTTDSKQTHMKQCRKQGNSGEKYRIDMILDKDTKPEDLKISRKDNVMSIEVKTEKTAEDGSSRLYQEYTKKITLPENVDLSQLKSSLLPSGVLTIQVPFLPQPEEVLPAPTQSRQIPVTVEGGDDKIQTN